MGGSVSSVISREREDDSTIRDITKPGGDNMVRNFVGVIEDISTGLPSVRRRYFRPGR